MFKRSVALFGLVVCLAVGLAPSAFAQLRTELYVSGLAAPVGFVQDPADPTIQYVIEQAGTIRVIREGSLLATPFLDLTGAILSGGERGLLGLAFPPDYAASGRLYVNFTNPIGDTVVARFVRSAGDPPRADPTSRFDLRWPSGDRFIAQPYSNHNGGHLVFGPDSYLYIGMGDGGSGNDPEHRAQNPNTLLGKMLRIDVSVADSDPNGYQVPADNPFVGGAPITALGEIWAFGLRNPWQFSFDQPALGGTGALVIGDVGQGTYEEIDYEPAGHGGRNYGWRNREGAHDNVTSLPPAYLPLIEPIFEVSHPTFGSITGGHVYRGSSLGTAFKGRYFFADFIAGVVWSIGLSIDGQGEASFVDVRDHTSELSVDNALGNISAMGQDADGELYVVNYSGGNILRIGTSSFVGPLGGGGWSGTISGSNLIYNGVSYPIVNGRVSFPDCTMFIVAPNGALIGPSSIPNCTPGGGGGLMTPTLTWPTPASVTMGTVLSAAQLNASASANGSALTGTFVFSPPAGTAMSAAGTQTLSVTFTPSNPAAFAGASASVTLQVTSSSGGGSFVGPAQGGGWSGTISGSNLIYGGVSYPIVNGRVSFPDCTIFIVAPNGALAGGSVIPNCTPGGGGGGVPPGGGGVFVGPTRGGGWSGTISGSNLIYNGVSYPIVNGRVSFPDCTMFIVAPDGALAGASVIPNCTPADRWT